MTVALMKGGLYWDYSELFWTILVFLYDNIIRMDINLQLSQLLYLLS